MHSLEQFTSVNEAALIRADEDRKCAAGLAGAHPGLQDRMLRNYTWIEKAHKARKKTFEILLFIDAQRTFSLLLPWRDIIKCLNASMFNNCCFWVRATILSCYRNWQCSQCGQCLRWSATADKIKAIVLDKQCFSKWVESPPWGRFWWARGRKKQRGDRGAKKHKGGESAQRLIDHWVHFSSLLLWLVSFLQILIYYDNCWRWLLKPSICWIFTLDCICARVQGGLFHGCGAVVKMTQFRLRSSSFHEHGSSSGDLGFHECGSGSGALFFHGSGSIFCFCSFSHINISIVMVCPKFNGKWIKSSTQLREYTKSYWV